MWAGLLSLISLIKYDWDVNCKWVLKLNVTSESSNKLQLSIKSNESQKVKFAYFFKKIIYFLIMNP